MSHPKSSIRLSFRFSKGSLFGIDGKVDVPTYFVRAEEKASVNDQFKMGWGVYFDTWDWIQNNAGNSMLGGIIDEEVRV